MSETKPDKKQKGRANAAENHRKRRQNQTEYDKASVRIELTLTRVQSPPHCHYATRPHYRDHPGDIPHSRRYTELC